MFTLRFIIIFEFLSKLWVILFSNILHIHNFLQHLNIEKNRSQKMLLLSLKTGQFHSNIKTKYVNVCRM